MGGGGWLFSPDLPVSTHFSPFLPASSRVIPDPLPGLPVLSRIASMGRNGPIWCMCNGGIKSNILNPKSSVLKYMYMLTLTLEVSVRHNLTSMQCISWYWNCASLSYAERPDNLPDCIAILGGIISVEGIGCACHIIFCTLNSISLVLILIKSIASVLIMFHNWLSSYYASTWT